MHTHQSTAQEYENEEIESSRAPLIEHFIELRRRVMVATVALLIGFGVCYAFSEPIYEFLITPLAHATGESAHRLIYTGLAEAFLTYIKLSFYSGIFVAFPVLAAQFYLFLAPGLYKKERKVLLPFLVASPLLFFAGAALCYVYVLPLAWQFFLGFEQSPEQFAMPIQLEARVSEYLSLVLQLMFAFGLAFQLPVLLMLLARVGIVTAEKLKRFRKYALIVVVAAAAILTPPDVISQIALAIPLYLLYELSIFGARWMERKAEG